MARNGVAAMPLLALCMLAFCVMNFEGAHGERLHSSTFKSPGFTLGPGDVIDQYMPVGMPKGHIAIRSLQVQVVDSAGTPILLSETYLHHWVLIRYYIDPTSTGAASMMETVPVANDGVCNPFLVQLFGLGSETRHTNTTVPPPYGIVVGDPDDVPEGLIELWFLNVHAIDTRGVVTPQGCTECVCDLYNVTVDGYGREIPPGYEGGMLCCHDQTHCPLRAGFEGEQRELFVEIAVTYVDFSDSVVPVKVYILDATDRRTSWDQPAQCQVEYTVPQCAEGSANCIHTQEAFVFLPVGGYIIYADAHLHNSGVVASILRENGDEICVSRPIYGQGNEAGNEDGYIVGMTTCYPEPGTVYVEPREKLKLQASYENTERHTGVMALYYILVAEGTAPPNTKGLNAKKVALGCLTVIGAVVTGVMIHRYRNKRRGGVNYKAIV